MQPLFLALSLLLASPAAAHGGVTGYKIEGKYYAGYANLGVVESTAPTLPPV
jgi:hypothetical protein